MSEYKLRPREDVCSCGHYDYRHGQKAYLFGIGRYNLDKPCIICTCEKFKKETIEDRNRSHNSKSVEGKN